MPHWKRSAGPAAAEQFGMVLVTLTVHASYESPADLEWIREATLRWIDDLRRLNSR